MEDSRIESIKFVTPHRRSPFKSQTNQVLPKILSLYGDQSHSVRLVKFVPYQHSSDTLSFDENIFSSPEKINEKRGCYHRELNRSNVLETKSFSVVRDKVIDRTNVCKGVSNCELEVLNVTEPESLRAVDDKGVSNHGGLCISDVYEAERFSSAREMDIDKSSTAKGAQNIAVLHLSEVKEQEKLSLSRGNDVDNNKVACSHVEFSSTGEEIVKQSRISEHNEWYKSDFLVQKDLSSVLAMDVDKGSGVCNRDPSGGSDVTKLNVLEHSNNMIVSNNCEFGSSDLRVSDIVISEVADESNKNRSREAKVASGEMSGLLNAEDDEVLLKKRENLAYGLNKGTNLQNNDSGKERMVTKKVEALLDNVVAVSLMREIVADKSNLDIGVCNQHESGDDTELKTLSDESIERGGSHKNGPTDAQMGLDEISNILNAEDSENLMKKRENMGLGENEESNFQNYQEKMMIDELAALVNNAVAYDHDNIMSACTALKDNELVCQSIIDTPNREISLQPLDSGNRTESGEFEEGEVSNIIKTEVLSTLHLENIGSLSKKLDTGINAVSEHETNIRDLESTDSFAMAVDSNVGSEGKVEIDDRDKEPGRQPNVVGRSQQPRSNSLVFYGDIIDGSGATKQGLESKKGDGSGKKKKRGPISEEKKGKKKQKERKRRAEKNRELGVKRLKLQTVVMPKKVVICRHYLNGRCHEGEKCNFSHDAVPLTKSKPCGHFARQCCMKGDDCPFDHDLSKYPCTNYTSKGFCGRGDNCLFSHKMVSKEGQGAGTEASIQGPKPSSTADNLKPMKQTDSLKKAADNVLKNLGISFKGVGQCTTQSHMGKSQISSSTYVERPSPVISELHKRTTEISVPAAQKSEDNVKTQPSVAPKGLNFLSFGRNSEIEGGIVVNQKAETLSPSAQMSTDNVKIQPSSAPKGINFLSFGRNNNPYSNSKPSSFFSSSVDEKGKSTEQNETKSLVTNLLSPFPSAERDQSVNNLENSSLKSLVLGSSSGQSSSSSYCTPLPYKNITNSSQKALSSTLAFAARWEKETTIVKKSTDEGTSSAVSNGKRKNSGGSEDDSAKTLKILDFLASMGRKR